MLKLKLQVRHNGIRQSQATMGDHPHAGSKKSAHPQKRARESASQFSKPKIPRTDSINLRVVAPPPQQQRRAAGVTHSFAVRVPSASNGDQRLVLRLPPPPPSSTAPVFKRLGSMSSPRSPTSAPSSNPALKLRLAHTPRADAPPHARSASAPANPNTMEQRFAAAGCRIQPSTPQSWAALRSCSPTCVGVDTEGKGPDQEIWSDDTASVSLILDLRFPCLLVFCRSQVFSSCPRFSSRSPTPHLAKSSFFLTFMAIVCRTPSLKLAPITDYLFS